MKWGGRMKLTGHSYLPSYLHECMVLNCCNIFKWIFSTFCPSTKLLSVDTGLRVQMNHMEKIVGPS